MYISTDVTSTLDIPLAYIFTVTQNDLQSILFYENYILSMLLFFFFFFFIRLLYGTIRKVLMKWRSIILVDLPYPLSFLSYQRKKLS